MQHPDLWGLIPEFLNPDDPDPVRKQFDKSYISGWRPMQGFTFNRDNGTLKYPGDPVMKVMDSFVFRDETIMLFRYAWVLVLQKDGHWEVSRMN